MKKCLYCYLPLNKNSISEYHEKCSLKFFGTRTAPVAPYNLNQIEDLAKQVIERSITVPGVQPKLSMSLIKDAIESHRLTVVGALDGRYILKPPNENYPEMPANEHFTMKLAERFGIEVVPASLVRLQSGELAYISRRIDRTEKLEKNHMLDMFQITEAFDKYISSLEKVGKTIKKYSNRTMLDVLNFYELVIFCFITGNTDMHLKNISMYKQNNDWLLSPAYDLLNTVIVTNDTEQSALTIGGKKKKINLPLLLQFGKDLDLTEKQIKNVFAKFKKRKKEFYALLDLSFLSDNLKRKYVHVFESWYEILELNE